MEGCDTVFHLAANADVRFGLEDPSRDFEQNTVGTFTVLEAMRAAGVGAILFSSSGSVYGEPEVVPTPEDCPFPVQTSLYAASKLAGEALIQAYCEGYGFTGRGPALRLGAGGALHPRPPLRLPRALREDPSVLVLGRRAPAQVVHVRGRLHRRDRDARATAPSRPARRRVFNLGTDEVSDVDTSIRAVCAHLGVAPRLEYTGGDRGWVGDSPLIHLDCSRMRALGWAPAAHDRRVACSARSTGWARTSGSTRPGGR